MINLIGRARIPLACYVPNDTRLKCLSMVNEDENEGRHCNQGGRLLVCHQYLQMKICLGMHMHNFARNKIEYSPTDPLTYTSNVHVFDRKSHCLLSKVLLSLVEYAVEFLAIRAAAC